MNFLRALYARLRDHFIKTVSTIGLVLTGLDLEGWTGEIRNYATQYLGDKAAHKVLIALFVLLILRATFVTWSQCK